MLTTRTRLFAALTLVLLGCRPAAESSAPTRESSGPIHDLIEHSEGFSGVVLVADGSSSSWYSRGLADDAEGRPFREGEPWRWASVTKQIVAVLVMQEVEAGRLSLDAKVSDVWPEFAGPTGDTVTVRQLLQHTSGLPDPDALSGPSFAQSYEPATYCQGEPIAAPGERFEYNNCDYWLLGELVERTAGQPWAALLQQRILEPAGMTTVRVGQTDHEDAVTGYERAGTAAFPMPLSKYGPAGALVGDPQDLLAFDRALMSGKLLSEASLEVLWDGDPALGYVALGAWGFPAALRGCEGEIQLVERRGYIAGVSVRNFMAPALDRAFVVFVNHGDFDFGEVWMGEGFSYELASAAFCE